MDFEKVIFKRAIPNFKCLEEYGFVKDEMYFKYQKKLNPSFEAHIFIGVNGDVFGKIYDLQLNEEYVNFRNENFQGVFVGKLRLSYEQLLQDIKKHCFIEQNFIGNQANRIDKLIQKEYQDKAEFLWEKYPSDGVFRNSITKKWYALIMNIEKRKIEKGSMGKVEILNLKLPEAKISSLLEETGFYPAYHMNKQKWISILLNDSITDDFVMEYVKESHSFTEK